MNTVWTESEEAANMEKQLQVAAGTQVTDADVAEAKKANHDKWIELAKEQHQRDGQCEIDENAVVSIGDDAGSYVAAWVWVERERCECGAWLDEDEGEGYDGSMAAHTGQRVPGDIGRGARQMPTTEVPIGTQDHQLQSTSCRR